MTEFAPDQAAAPQIDFETRRPSGAGEWPLFGASNDRLLLFRVVGRLP